MKLEFNRPPKRKLTGVRLTDPEFLEIAKIAEKNKFTISETCRVLIVSALNELKKNK